MKGPIRLLALDLDGTTLRSDRTIHPDNAAAIRRADEAGLVIVAASGRFAPSIDQHLSPLGLPYWAIAANGAHIRDDAGRDVAITSIGQPLLVDLHAYAESEGVHMNVYTPTEIHMVRPTEWQHVYISRLGSDRHIRRGTSVTELRSPIKAMLIDDPGRIQMHRQALETRLDLTDVTIVESEPDYLEFIHRRAGKGEALQKAASAMKIDQGQTAAIGDFLNDLEMVAWAGVGAAVANAHPAVLEVADLVVSHHDDAGVAEFVDAVLRHNASFGTLREI